MAIKLLCMVRQVTLNRVYTEQVLEYLGYQICHSEQEVRTQLAEQNFAYLPLDVISPVLSELISLEMSWDCVHPFILWPV